MSEMTVHERPGVYSSYDASAVVSASGGSATVGLAAVTTKGEDDTLYKWSRYEEAEAVFGSGDPLSVLVRLLFQNGAGAVYAVPVREETGYDNAFALLAGEEGVSLITCDSTDATVHQALRDSVNSASQARRERIAVVEGAAGENTQALTERAQALNAERLVLVGPTAVGEQSGLLAAAVAGAIAKESDPAVPLGGAPLTGLEGLSQKYGDSEIDVLVKGGVTPVEEMGGIVSVVRGITTRTKTGEASDLTWRELTTIRIVDDVIPTIRNALRSRFRRAKNTEQSRGAIRSQVVLELENKLSREIITGYGEVTAQADSENPTVCVVEFPFTVAHGLNQIWVSAHITV